MFYQYLRNALFHLDPEQAHGLTIKMCATAGDLGMDRWVRQRTPPVPLTLAGLSLANPVGLAAGFDKNGEAIDALAALGFGFIEVGTVTPRPQPGNAKPRIFRLAEHYGLINRLGFNNDGVDALVNNVRRSKYWRSGGVVGVNIGKNKDTPNESAVDDYLLALEKACEVARYITVNISSPNTVGLRDLQQPEALRVLLGRLMDKKAQCEQYYPNAIPLFVKLAPEMAAADIAAIAEVILASGVDGVIATNTTTERTTVRESPHAAQAGGLSGAPLLAEANQALAYWAQALRHKLPIIGVGGILSGNDAACKLQLGARAVQLYTGLIYRGPGLVREAVTASIGLTK